MDELMNRLNNSYVSLQELNIKPTKENASTILYVLITIERVKEYINNLPKDGDKEDGTVSNMAEN